MASKKNIPHWHTKESARIEALRWNESIEDFEILFSHVRNTISEELRQQGKNLSEITSDDELRREVRSAGESYDEKRRKLIGLEIHVTLWVRGFVATRMRGIGESKSINKS